MLVYYYDENRCYTGHSAEAPLDPVEQKPMIPGSATTLEPPTAGDNEAVQFNNEAWELVPDFSGTPYYSKTDGQEKRFKVGEAFDDNYTELKQDDPDATWNGTAWELTQETLDKREIEAQKAILTETDWYIIRSQDETSSKPVPQDIIDKRQLARDTIETLEVVS